MIDEEKLRLNSTWGKVSEIPDFPFTSFDELISSVKDGSYTINPSYSTARELSALIRTPIGSVINFILLLVPWLFILVLIGISIWLQNYYLLFGIPIVALFFLMSNPLLPMPGPAIINKIVLLAFFVFLIALWGEWQTAEWLIASMILPFLSNREMYRENINALYKEILSSEPLFLYLFEKYGVEVRNSLTGEEYYNKLDSTEE